MKPAVLATVFAAAAVLTVSACAPPVGPRDTGNMAFPAPLPQGNISTTAGVRSPDTGNMAFPAPLPQGNIGTTMGVRAPDTGNMAYPASPTAVGNSNMPASRGADTNGAQYQPNLPQGQLGTTRTTR